MNQEEELSSWFSKEEELLLLCQEAFAIVHLDVFADILQRLLKQYYISLSKQARTEPQHRAAKLYQSRTRREIISQEIIDRLISKGDNDSLRTHPSCVRYIEYWSTQDTLRFPQIPFLAMSEEESDSEEETHFAESMSKEPPLDVSEIKIFLREGFAVRQLVFNLRLLLLPTDLGSLVRIALSLPNDRVWFSEAEDVSMSNRMKTFVEIGTGQTWNWWPLRSAMHRLQSSQVRMNWRCVSTHRSIPASVTGCRGAISDQYDVLINMYSTAKHIFGLLYRLPKPRASSAC